MSVKKEAVLAAGKRLFLDQGIVQTSMEQIAEAVPVSKMTIYNYFQSKEGLLDQVVDEMLQEVWGKYRDLMDRAKDPLDALNLMYREQDQMSLPMSQPFLTDLVKFPDQMNKMLQFNQDKVLPEFEMLIFKGQQKGQIRKDISPHLLVAFLTFIKEYSARTNWYEGLGSPAAVGEQIMTILYYGIIQKHDGPGVEESEVSEKPEAPDEPDSTT
ncbi:TetR/AcrR family transcriptional regulator [Paenibacillus lemnae]|uniref:TetR/AcrR family transcriptional regulator n=1 Tax=Paenibacillus lemnae TaxID=1330551 RepID=A0A848M1W9_PAELE|nr:TetR/AcrR family transcriptional regulator [Paenibacillus lemnae]NMO94745.1 TetR/AcrR family transcriptional regulator [Paenibacillus lemnae]